MRDQQRNDAHADRWTKAGSTASTSTASGPRWRRWSSYLDAVDPSAVAAARDRSSCFDHVRGQSPEYGHAVALDIAVPCEDQVVAELIDLRRRGRGEHQRRMWTDLPPSAGVGASRLES
jgi:hypothetical protein